MRPSPLLELSSRLLANSPRAQKPLRFGLARFPIAQNRAIDKKSRQLNRLERILIEKACELLRNSR